MKLPFKIVLINVGAAILFSFFMGLITNSNMSKEFISIYGMVGLFGGLFEIVLGLFLLLLPDKRYAQGFLLSGGILLLSGFVACSATFSVDLR
jgi:hypothetical protein